MVEIINCILINFTNDMVLSCALKQFFDLKTKYIELFFLQIITIAPVMVYLFCGITEVLFVLLKVLAGLLVCVLITDSFSFKYMLKLTASYIVLLFSVYGFSWFMVLFFKSVINQTFSIKVSSLYDGLLFLSVGLYIALIFFLARGLSNFKRLKNYLTKVSFLLFDKHIELIGLLDSGNSLVDTVTHKPVIVVSIDVIKKYFNDIDFEMIEKSYLCERVLNCVSAGGVKFEMPIYDVGAVCVKSGSKIKSYNCVLGFVNQKFYDDKNYQCLLHRSFI